MECIICQRFTKTSGACLTCISKIRMALSQLPDLQDEAGHFLTPSRTGSGAVTSERSIGINVNALDFHMATEMLRVLHSWEVIIRSQRRLTPPAYLLREPTIAAEVWATCNFHLAHLDYSLTQVWAFDFAQEVFTFHARGRSAAKRFSEQPRRIPCPSDDCRRFVVIDVANLMQELTCFGCKSTWSLLRLIALAMSNPHRKFYLDVEAIAMWLGVSERSVYKSIKDHEIDRKGNLYDMAAIVALRSAG
jgi:hypothetical protein